MMRPTILQCGRRLAEITDTHVQLFLQDNKRKPPRPVRQGSKTMPTRAECIYSGLTWVERGFIDFIEQ